MLKQITGPPLPPSNVQVDCAEPEQAKVSWRPQFQGGSSQTFFVQIIVNDTWVVIEDNITQDKQNDRILHVFHHLQIDSHYIFRVGSVNDNKEEIFSVNSASCIITGKNAVAFCNIKCDHYILFIGLVC